jgi:hypothetical protein
MSGRRQPQRIPPPIDHGSERIDAEPVLREHPGDLGLALWKTVRSVRLWTDLPAEARAAAFDGAAYERRMALLRSAVADAGLRADLELAAAVLRGEANAGEVAEACRRVANWAFEEATGTALHFIQAAAFASPMDASLAWRVATIARSRAEYAWSETWCRQTMSVARRTRDWKHFVFALIGLSMVQTARGNLPMARKSAHRALRVARRHSLREMTGYAYTALLGVTHASKPREMERNARGALEAFGPGHPWLPALAHNVAGLWMEQGYFGAALTVFLRIPHDFGPPDVRLGIGANTARAAAAVGDLRSYREARDRCEVLLAHPRAQQSAAVSLINLGRAALQAGEWDYAEDAAERAGRLAAERGQSQEVLSAESLSEAIRADRRAGAATPGARTAIPTAVEQLAADLSAALEPSWSA